MVPGQLTPPNPAADLSAQIPGLSGINASIFGNLASMAKGAIPQGDQNFMQDQAAATAAGSGMKGTNVMPGTLEGNSAARNLDLLQYNLMNQAAQQYPSLTGAVSQTQTLSPQLQLEVAGTNALNASAPNPGQAQSYAQQLYNQYLQQARGPAGGTGGATGSSGGNSWDQWWNTPEPNYANGPIGYGPGGGPTADLGQNIMPVDNSLDETMSDLGFA